MKRYAIPLILLCCLAALFLAAAALFLCAGGGGYHIEGEVLFGERPEAAGFIMTDSEGLGSAGLWRGYYDPASGGQVMLSGWEFTSVDRDEAEPSVSVETFSRMFADSGYDYPALAEALKGFIDGGGREARVPLNSYTDAVPIRVNLMVPSGGSSWHVRPVDAYAELFRVPLPEGTMVDFARDEPSGIIEASLAEGSEIYSASTSVYSGGYIYFTFELRRMEDALGGVTGGLLDGSLLPGGDWGVWRVPYPFDEDDPPEPEPVLSLGHDFERAELAPGPEGDTVLLYTVEGGTLSLDVLDGANGRLMQSVELLDGYEPSYLGVGIDYYDSPGGAVFAAQDGRAVTAELSGRIYAGLRRWEPNYDLQALLGENWGVYARECLFCGGRLALLYEVLDYSGQDSARGTARLLMVFEDGGRLAYAERIGSQLWQNSYNRVSSQTGLSPSAGQ